MKGNATGGITIVVLRGIDLRQPCPRHGHGRIGIIGRGRHAGRKSKNK